MANFEDFNVRDPKYKKVSDLPRAVQPDFIDEEGGGFVTKEAAQTEIDAERKAYSNKKHGEDQTHNPSDSKKILFNSALELQDAREGVLNLLQAAKDENPNFSYTFMNLNYGSAHTPKEFSGKRWGRRYLNYLIAIEDVDFFKKAVEIVPDILQDAPQVIRNNKEIVIKAVSRDVSSVQYAAPRLQKDRDVVEAGFKQDPTLAARLFKEEEIDRFIES